MGPSLPLAVFSFSSWFSRLISKISRSFSSLRWFDCSSFYRSSLLLLSSSRTILMLSTSRSENQAGGWLPPCRRPGERVPRSSGRSGCRADSISMCWLALASYQVSPRTCLFSSLMVLERGSSFTVGWLVMYEALVAQVRVERFSSRNRSLGQRHATMRQQLLPPMDCLRIEVSLESRQGTQAFSFLPRLDSDRMLITWRRVKRDLFMSMLSLACRPSVPVSPIRSDPAKSTSYSLLLNREFEAPLRSQLSIRSVRMQWDRELCTLSLWLALIRCLSPASKWRRRSASLWHSNTNRFSTLNCSSLFQRSRSPAPPRSASAAGLRRSKMRSLQICRKETEREQVRSRQLVACCHRRWNMRGMSPDSASLSPPCMVKVLPEPVCPQAKMVAWQPLSALSTRWSTWHSAQRSSWEACWSKMQSKVKVRSFCASCTRTSLRQGRGVMSELAQPFLISVLRKGRMRMAALILLFINKINARAQGQDPSLITARYYCLLMFCGCQGKRRAELPLDQHHLDSPLQVRLVKMLGLKNYLLDKFLFRRKPPSYSIRNQAGTLLLLLNQQPYLPPPNYHYEVRILENRAHSVPVVRLRPLQAEEGTVLPCIVYAHGNASDMGDSVSFVSQLAGRVRAEFIVFDYTGYGQSQRQEVGEEVICDDLEMVLAWANRPLQQVVLWGFSLGSFPVAVNSAKYQVGGCVLQCPIGSLSCMFYDQYAVNVRFREDHFANIEVITGISSPILMMHSVADEIIPIEQARLLYQKFVRERGDRNIEFIQVEKIRHNSFHRYIASHVANDLQKEVLGFLTRITAGMQPTKEAGGQEGSQLETARDSQCLPEQLQQLQETMTQAKIRGLSEEAEFQIEPEEQGGREGRFFPSSWYCCGK